MIYLLTKNDKPYFGGLYKYNIRHKYNVLTLEEQATIKIYYASRARNWEFVQKTPSWLQEG